MGVPPYLVLLLRFLRSLSSSLRGWEKLQTRRRLALLGGHQIAFLVQAIGLVGDTHCLHVIDAEIFRPLRPRLRRPAIALLHRPGPRQGVVGDGHLVVQQILVCLVEIDALLDDGLVVLMQRNAAEVEGARPAEVTGLDFEHVELAVTILVDPFADGIAVEAGLDIVRPGTAVGEDAPTGLTDIVDPYIGRPRQHDDFHRLIRRHHCRHAGRQTCYSGPCGRDAGLALAQVRLEDGLILRRQRRLLSAARRLAGIERILRRGTRPLTFQVRINGSIECLRARDRERADTSGDCNPAMHYCPPRPDYEAVPMYLPTAHPTAALLAARLPTSYSAPTTMGKGVGETSANPPQYR